MPHVTIIDLWMADFSCQEIANITGQSLGEVRSIVAAAKAQAKTRLHSKTK
jgi:DNA-directed RNA polymerase specialized sigma24 family protein